AGSAAEAVGEGLVHLVARDVADELEHELRRGEGGDDLGAVTGAGREVEAGDVDVDVEDGRFARAQAVENEVLARDGGAVRQAHALALLRVGDAGSKRGEAEREPEGEDGEVAEGLRTRGADGHYDLLLREHTCREFSDKGRASNVD